MFLSAAVFALPSVKMTIKVLNESGQPIEGATAGLTFSYTPTGGSPKTSSSKGLTDVNGLFVGTGDSIQYFTYWATKEGYYSTTKKFRLSKITGIPGFRSWEPWNQTIEVVLKKKENPIAMYAVRMKSKDSKYLPTFPFLDRFVGYDLVAGDWMTPHGQGTHRDIMFKFEKYHAKGRTDHHVKLTMAFSNEGDGLLSYYTDPNRGSKLRLPHHAPITGYEPQLVIDKHRTKTKILSGAFRDDQNYFFRIRTEKDNKGNIISALYGKIYDPIELGLFIGDKNPTGSVFFDYYLNPTSNDTNVEFDPKKNLFKDLTVNEEVSMP